MADTEQLREALVDLERSRNRERDLRIESEALLAGLSVLALSEDTDSMFAQLFEVLRSVFQFESAAILTMKGDHLMHPIASTCPVNQDVLWEVGDFTRRVLAGTPAAVFDITRIPEWRAVSICEQPVRSALHVPLRGRTNPAMLICVHSTVGFFTQRHIRLARRFAPLASQGLLNIELQHTILERNRFFTLSLEMMCITGFDGHFKQVNQAWSQGLGLSAAELMGTPLVDQLHPDERSAFLCQLATLKSGDEKALLECRHRSQKGEFRWLYCRITAYAEEQLYYIVAQDIHERKLMEKALRDSEERYALAALGVNDGLWDWNIRTGEVYYSPRWKSMLGYGVEEVDSSVDAWFSRILPEDRERVASAISSHLQGRTSHCESEYRILHRDGSYRWMLSRGVAVRDGMGEAYRMAGSQSDITERKHAEERLEHDALYDALTGLPNRTLFLGQLNSRIERAREADSYQYAVLFMDLDRFKVVNDGLGHRVGDLLLQEFSRRLTDSVRDCDVVARLGGDEFTVLLTEMQHSDDALTICERIRTNTKIPFILEGYEITSSASVGITLGDRRYERADDILRDADTAMYRAKALGKARHELFDSAMHDAAVNRLHLETELRQAIERDEIHAYYQPIVALETGELRGFEALARWRHPVRNLVSPAEFIPLAEETGLIVPLGRRILVEACTQMRTWLDQHSEMSPEYINVNLSARQLTQPGFSGEIRDILRQTGLPAYALNLEITETMLLERRNNSADTLRELRALGVKLSIDDFGTGYSSLSYLQRFPVDTLKIDRSFVSQMCGAAGNSAIVRAILALAGSLNIGVVAEGVETSEQVSMLLSLGCTAAQGFYFAPPMSAEATSRYILESAKRHSVRRMRLAE